MCDFDLSEVLECSPESRFPSCDMEEVKSEVFELSDSLDLVVAHNRKTMKSMANLVLTVNKLRKSLSQCGRDLSDDQLCSAIMDCVVEETIFQKGWNSSMGERKPTFQRINSGKQITLCDIYQKNLIQNPRDFKLQAVTLRGGYCERKVNLGMSSYAPYCSSTIDSLTVLLSITKDLHISCSLKDDKVLLTLEKYSNEDLQEISKDQNMDRFLFIKSTMGLSLTTFESVKYRGWFISTSYEDSDQTVEMCQAAVPGRVTSFNVL
ncbi:interleukin-1 beta [Girardinichthys multiradiatus]|uniref:interleukin-1 beta n=1 Tax=Girardinichthys multiradiatus TaxID=208333 RepID=UPI001FAE67AD|nr:interleukin-1 beta [Girardinichthys multiradiatus]